MPDEEAFSLLVRLMYSYDLRGHFLPEMPKLQLRLVSCQLTYKTTEYSSDRDCVKFQVRMDVL
jgi:hypothetical protein